MIKDINWRAEGAARRKEKKRRLAASACWNDSLRLLTLCCPVAEPTPKPLVKDNPRASGANTGLQETRTGIDRLNAGPELN